MAILVFSPNGTHVTKPTLEAARTSADCAGKTVVVTSALTAAQSNITAAWPADRVLEVKKGGSIANTVLFTINGSFSAGLYQIFTGAGAVLFGTGSIKEIYPQWWGAKGDNITDNTAAFAAVAACMLNMDGGTLYIPEGIYLTDSFTIQGRAKHIEGSTPGAPSLNMGVQIKARSIVTNFITVSGNGHVFERIYINGNNMATNTLRITDSAYDSIGSDTIIFRDMWISGAVNGGVNVSITPIVTQNIMVDKIMFQRVYFNGRDGGSGIKNVVVSSLQAILIPFYSCSFYASNDGGTTGTPGDIDTHIQIIVGGVSLYSCFFAGATVRDVEFRLGKLSMIDCRSESVSPVLADSIYISAPGLGNYNNGPVNITGFVHAGEYPLTTVTVNDYYTGKLVIMGGRYCNINLNTNFTDAVIINPQFTAGGSCVRGTHPERHTMISGGTITLGVNPIVTGVYAGDITIPYQSSLKSVNSAGTAAYPLISATPTDNIILGPSPQLCVDVGGQALRFTERAAPVGTPDKATIYAKDNGAGKTQLMVIFGSGVAQQIAIEV